MLGVLTGIYGHGFSVSLFSLVPLPGMMPYCAPQEGVSNLGGGRGLALHQATGYDKGYPRRPVKSARQPVRLCPSTHRHSAQWILLA